MSRLLPSERYEELKVEVADLIEDYELSYPLDLWELATRLRIPVRLASWSETPFPSPCGNDGFTIADEDPNGLVHTIVVNSDMPKVRQRFTLGHELGHIWLEHLHDPDRDENVEESEANFFASYLLAPTPVVNMALAAPSPEGIAQKFDMSRQAAMRAFERVCRDRRFNARVKAYYQRIANAATVTPASVPRTCGGEVAV